MSDDSHTPTGRLGVTDVRLQAVLNQVVTRSETAR